MSYSDAKKKYAAIGVDTEKAIRALKKIPISLNSWQLDDIGGWEHPTTTAPGNYPGRPRTPDELFGIAVIAASSVAATFFIKAGRKP